MLNRLKTIGNSFRHTQREYQAALNALNIFFGAVIGVNLAAADGLPMTDYIVLLVVVAVMVMGILFVSYTHRLIWNGAMLVMVLGIFWYFVEYDDGFEFVPEKLMPTLAVWAAMAILVEFAPRAIEPGEGQESA